MERVDLFTGVHKGIRRILGELVARAGRTDFASGSERAALATAMREAYELLESHAHHEHVHVMPLVRRAAPDVAARLDRDHGEHGKRLIALVAEVERDDACAGTAVKLTRLAAEIELHMADEEQLAQPVLWRSHDDATLGEVHHAIVSSIPPETMARFLAFMLPALNAPERARLLLGMGASAPDEALRGVVALARTVLEPADLERLARDARDVFARAA